VFFSKAWHSAQHAPLYQRSYCTLQHLVQFLVANCALRAPHKLCNSLCGAGKALLVSTLFLTTITCCSPSLCIAAPGKDHTCHDC
jgi:hypothetical protein